MTDRLPFIDWMKSLGMLAIVYGHTAGISVAEVTQPFNPKQLGVAFFVFVMGFSLARETRPSWRVFYNRLFEMYLFGWLFALLISGIVMIRSGDLNESNYMPLLFGVNVFFNYFPANPTTWFIGTYFHLLLLWVLLARRWKLELWTVATVALLEIPVRALLMHSRGDFVAYTLLTNWIGVFLLGLWAGRQRFTTGAVGLKALGYLCALVAVLVGWPLVTAQIEIGDSFPFRRLTTAGLAGTLLLTSACITALYLTHTWLLFQITRRLPDLFLIRLFARNTIIVFIAHVPLVYALTPMLYQWIPPGGYRVVINLLIFYVVLTLAAEVLRQLIQPKRLRDAVERLSRHPLPRDRAAI